MPWSFMNNTPFSSRMKISFQMVLWICALVFGLMRSPCAFSYEIYPFHGQIDFREKKLELVAGDGDPSLISFRLVSLPENNFHIHLDIEHIQSPLFDLSTQLEGDLTLVEPSAMGGRSWKGQFQSRYSLLNHKPIEELSGTFEIKNHVLYLSDLSVAGVHLQGLWELADPRGMDLAIQFKDISLKDFMALWAEDPNLEAQGLMSGNLQISGHFPRLILKGTLASYAGQVGDLLYDSIVLNFQGQWPLVKLMDSIVTESEGISFRMEGNLDLSSHQALIKDISALNKSPLVSAGDPQWEWTIKRKEKDKDSSSELKYFLRKEDQNNQSPSAEDSDLLGVEQKIKF